MENVRAMSVQLSVCGEVEVALSQGNECMIQSFMAESIEGLEYAAFIHRTCGCSVVSKTIGNGLSPYLTYKLQALTMECESVVETNFTTP